MNIAVPSRFACLKVEDDDIRVESRNTKKNVKSATIKKQGKKKDEPPKKNMKQQCSQAKKDKPKKKEATEKQWEEWQEKDKEFVTGHFEKDLESAILMSKLEYEERKKQQLVKSDESEKKNEMKKKKNKTITLDAFLASTTSNGIDSISKEVTNEDNFFETMQNEIVGEIQREKFLQLRKEREANIDEVIINAQYEEKFERERKRNDELQKELDCLKLEMKDVKSRNKTLCGILGQGEMKDKAGVLLELETLQTVRNELTEEVSKLHALLEQERSKVASLQVELQQQNRHKERKNKKHALNN